MKDPDEGLPELTFWGALVQGLGLKRSAQKAVIQAIWVSVVTTYILWSLGFVTFFGAGFARADDQARIIAQLGSIQSSSELNVRISLQKEIRDRVQARCEAQDSRARRLLDDIIEKLQDDYQRLTKERYPEPGCR